MQVRHLWKSKVILQTVLHALRPMSCNKSLGAGFKKHIDSFSLPVGNSPFGVRPAKISVDVNQMVEVAGLSINHAQAGKFLEFLDSRNVGLLALVFGHETPLQLSVSFRCFWPA